jgi:hypothetical protein
MENASAPAASDDLYFFSPMNSFLFHFLRAGLLVLCCGASFAFAQTIAEKKFHAATEAEVLLDLTASAPGADWGAQGREAAAATIFVDGQYQQDLLLFNGARQHTYQLLLGRQQPGEHTCRIELNRKYSAAQATTISIHELKFSVIDRQHPEFQAIAHAPLLYARPNTIGRFSDVPLLAYYEKEQKDGKTVLRYTMIFSNEDGGTQTSGLMSRWGRTTDIEWVTETELAAQGRAVKTLFQGIGHRTTEFRGPREGEHPLLITASDNNNFADNQTSGMRFALRPLPVDLRNSSREEIMDRHPWTYRVMAEEMVREGKITNARAVGPLIADLRRYLFIDACSTQNGDVAVSFSVKLKGDARWYPSDWGINGYKIERTGYLRSTALLPPGVKLNAVERIAVRCDVFGATKTQAELAKLSEASCEFKGLNKIFLLENDYQPGKPRELRPQAATLKFGEAIEFGLDNR